MDNGVMVCRWTLDFWHCRQDRVQLRESSINAWPYIMSFCVARMPGCESEWRDSKTARRNEFGTSGRAAPVEVSQRMVDSDIARGTASSFSEEGEGEDRRRRMS